MFSKVLVKLVDQAILPAILLLAVRVCSIFLIAKYHGLDFVISEAGFVFDTSTDYIFVNSYSILSMIVILAVGVLYVLLKSYIFHDSHITPVLSARLFSLRMTSLIQSSFDLYSQGTVWLSYMYLVTLVAGSMAYFGFIYGWVFITSLTLTLLSTGLLIYDIEREVPVSEALIREDLIESTDEYVLRFGGKDA